MAPLLYRPISLDEVRRLQFELSISNSPRGIKRALQDVCRHYETGFVLRDSNDLRQLIHSHLSSKEILVRRWALKALGLIRHPDDLHRIVGTIKVETDYEAVTWGLAAMFANAQDRSAKEMCELAGIDADKPIQLAARLYATDEWIKAYAEDVVVSLDDDEVSLKWAAFLAGYDKAPVDLFHPKHSNGVFLGELNKHDSPEVAEYSVWALCERKEFDASDLTIRVDQAKNYPENMRKWLYQLMAKSRVKTGLDADAVKSLRASDRSGAIEGLARGIVASGDPIYDGEILRWAGTENDPAIRDVLLTGMARRGDSSATLAEFVQGEFMAAPPGGRVRQHLMASTSGTRLGASLTRIAASEQLQSQGLLALGDNNVLMLGGEMNMTKGNSLTINGNVTAQNVAAGDVIVGVQNTIQSIQEDRRSDREILLKILDAVRSVKEDSAEKQETLAAMEAVARDAKPENKNRLLEALKTWGRVAVGAASLGGGSAEIISLAMQLLG